MTIFSVPGFVPKIEKFNSRSIESKNAYLLELGSEGAEIFLSENDVDPDDVFDVIYENIELRCNEECKKKHNEMTNKIYTIEEQNKYLDKKNQQVRADAVFYLKAIYKSMTELEQIPNAWRESRDPSRAKKQAIARVDAVTNKGISEDEAKEMKRQIEKAFKFDPRYTTSIKEIVNGVKKGRFSLGVIQ